MKKDILLAGVGGQGILSIATVVGAAAIKAGLFMKQAEVHGMSQRGGDVQSTLRLSSTPIYSDLIALGSADLVISMEPMEVLRYLPYLSAEGWIVSNATPFVNIPNYPDMSLIEAELDKLPRKIVIDIDAIAKEMGSVRAANMVLLGACTPYLGLSYNLIQEAVSNIFARKGEAIVDLNLKALQAGRDKALIPQN